MPATNPCKTSIADVSRQPRHDGFTIIELLVVLSIILLLVAILLPSMKQAREVTRRAVCASNQHQIIVAALGYAGDNLGMLTPTYHTRSDLSAIRYWPMAYDVPWWDNYSASYGLSDGVLSCPSQPRWERMPFSQNPPGGGWDWSGVGEGVYYGSLCYIGGADIPPTHANNVTTWRDWDAIPTRLNDLSDGVLTFDIIKTPHNIHGQPVGAFNGNHVANSTLSSPQHNRPRVWTTSREDLWGTNIGRLDGSVAWKDGSQFPDTLINVAKQPNSPNLIHADNGVFNTSLYW